MSYLNGAKKLRAAMDTAGNAISDAQALACKLIYQQWSNLIGTTATPGQRFLHGDMLYRVRTDASQHTFSAEWVPGVPTAALYEVIDEEHSGTIDDPIDAARGMEYTYGLYYKDPENGKIYLCERAGAQTGATITLQYLPHELIGHYFTEVI